MDSFKDYIDLFSMQGMQLYARLIGNNKYKTRASTEDFQKLANSSGNSCGE